AVEAADDVAVGLAQGARDPLVLAVGEEVAEGVRPFQPRRPHLDLVQRHRSPHLAAEAEPRPDPFRRLRQLRGARRLVLVPPPPVLEAPPGHAAPTIATSGRLSSGERRRPPRSRAPFRVPPRFCPSPPA